MTNTYADDVLVTAVPIPVHGTCPVAGVLKTGGTREDRKAPEKHEKAKRDLSPIPRCWDTEIVGDRGGGRGADWSRGRGGDATSSTGEGPIKSVRPSLPPFYLSLTRGDPPVRAAEAALGYRRRADNEGRGGGQRRGDLPHPLPTSSDVALARRYISSLLKGRYPHRSERGEGGNSEAIRTRTA